jgi:hypothetical protein
MNEDLFKILSFILFLIIIGSWVFIAIFLVGIQSSWWTILVLVVPTIGLSFVFILFFFLIQNHSPPLKGQLVLRCPKCGKELTIDDEICPQCGRKLPHLNPVSK